MLSAERTHSNLDRCRTLCRYAFRHGVSLRAQTPNAPQNTKTLFDSAFLYLAPVLAAKPEFLGEITSLPLPDDVALALGGKFPAFDAKAYLTERAEARRLEEKLKAKKPFG